MRQPTRTRRIAFRSFGLFGVISVALLITAGPAFAAGGVAQNGWYQIGWQCCDGAQMDGWRTDINVTRMSTGTYSCVINSVLSGYTLNDTRHQLENGAARCGSGTNGGIDGTCADQINMKFIETYSETSGYDCVEHGTAVLNVSYTYRVTRVDPTLSGDIDYAAYIDGTKYRTWYMTSTGNGDHVFSMAWAELSWVDGGGCNSTPTDTAHYNNLSRYNYSNGNFHDINDATHFSSGVCFSVSSITNQSFDATLN